jgi:hypothetical protein
MYDNAIIYSYGRGDGYTIEERGKFFDDMKRMTADLFQGETFNAILPVFIHKLVLIIRS